MVSETDYAYLAGLIDGDGTISFEVTYHRRNKKFNFYPQLKIALTKSQKWLLEELSKHYGGSVYTKKQFAEWYITNRKVIKKLLEKLIPYLKLKKENAQIVLEGIKILEDALDNRFPRYLLKEDIEKLMDVVERLRNKTKEHQNKKIKWTKETVLEIINSDRRYTKEYLEERRDYLMNIGKRGKHFKKGHVPWNKMTAEKEKAIVDEYIKGTPLKEIHNKFSVSITTIYKVLKRNGIPTNRHKNINR